MLLLFVQSTPVYGELEVCIDLVGAAFLKYSHLSQMSSPASTRDIIVGISFWCAEEMTRDKS